MRSSLIVSIALIVGTLLGYFGSSYNANSDAIKAVPIAVPVPLDSALLSEEEAQQQRANNYQSVRGIADILSLPNQFARTEALVALAARSDIDAVIELIAAAQGVSSVSTRLQLTNILLSRFAELDTPLALEYLLSSGMAAKEPHLLDALFSEWAKTDLNAALRGVRQLNEREHIQTAGDAISQAHVQHGEKLAQEIMAQLPSEYDTTYYKASMLALRAISAPAEALEEALLLKDPQQQSSAVYSVMRQWAEQDVRAAANHLLNLKDAPLKDGMDSMILQSTIVQEYVEQDPAAALEWIVSNVKGRESEQMLETALTQMVQENPDQAITYLDSLPVSHRTQNLLLNVATNWAIKDPEAAAHWVSKQDSVHAETLNYIAQRWAEQDAEAAGRYVENLPKSARPQWISSVASGYAQRDPAAAINWLQQYEAQQGYSSALDNVLSQWSYNDPLAALAYIEREQNVEKFPNATVNAISRLAEQDTAGTLARVEAMQGGALQQAAVWALMDTWANRDMQGLDNWTKSRDAGPVRDRAVEALVTRLGDKPERAIALINSVQSEELRMRSGMQFLLASGVDADKTQELAARLNLPENKRQEITNTLRDYQNASPTATPFGIVQDR